MLDKIPCTIGEERTSEFAPLPRGAEFLCCSRATLYNMAKRGELELVRLAGRTLIRWAELERIAANAQPWTTPAREKSTKSK
jgi:predicted DNA-binding transcriptional regulator AlpA